MRIYLLIDKLKKLLMQFIKFGFVGGLSTAVSLGVCCGLIFMGIGHIAAISAGYFLSLAFSYMLNHRWVFEAGNTRVAVLCRVFHFFFDKYCRNVLACGYT
jgi:putative flippase GtrA